MAFHLNIFVHQKIIPRGIYDARELQITGVHTSQHRRRINTPRRYAHAAEARAKTMGWSLNEPNTYTIQQDVGFVSLAL